MKITVGAGSSENVDKPKSGIAPEVVVIWHHSAIMRNHSNYINVMLSNPMKESKTYDLSFPDIKPSTWCKMMEFLECPMKARQMKVEDARVVAPFYDQYDFYKGCQLCNLVLEEYFIKSNKEARKRGKQQAPDLDLLVDALILADTANLHGAKKEGLKYFEMKFSSVTTPYGRTMFKEFHVKKLAPFIANETTLSNCFSASTDEILSPLFPSLAVLRFAKWETVRVLESMVRCLRLSGTRCKADGDFFFEDSGFTSDRIGQWGGAEFTFEIARLKDDWVIYGKPIPEVDEDGEYIVHDSIVVKILWRSPYSESLILPPKDNWEAVDSLAYGQPNITYILEAEM